jgi:hypothetical protein
MGNELPGPLGWWKVWSLGSQFDYSFGYYNTVEYTRPDGSVSPGTWKLQGDWLMITWTDYGGVERWDLPLFGEYQTGIAGHDVPIVAKFHGFNSPAAPLIPRVA